MLTKEEIQRIMQSLLKQTVVPASADFPFDVVRTANFTSNCDMPTQQLITKLSLMSDAIDLRDSLGG